VTKTLKNAHKSKRNSSLDYPSGGTTYKYIKHQKLLLKTHPEFNEKWVQEKIAEDPSILGIGELILKDQAPYYMVVKVLHFNHDDSFVDAESTFAFSWISSKISFQ